ncbi:hypothetical protein ACJX0J_041415, partial [Zea mays]
NTILSSDTTKHIGIKQSKGIMLVLCITRFYNLATMGRAPKKATVFSNPQIYDLIYPLCTSNLLFFFSYYLITMETLVISSVMGELILISVSGGSTTGMHNDAHTKIYMLHASLYINLKHQSILQVSYIFIE